MKFILSLCAMIAAVMALNEDTYDTSYENFDVRQLLENPRVLKNYGKCFLDQGPCSPEGSEFKKAIPEVLETACAKCTRKHREIARTVIHAFMAKQPELWNQLVQKWDPNGKYRKSFKNFLNETN